LQHNSRNVYKQEDNELEDRLFVVLQKLEIPRLVNDELQIWLKDEKDVMREMQVLELGQY
jgi:hypothetical protein